MVSGLVSVTMEKSVFALFIAILIAQHGVAFAQPVVEQTSPISGELLLDFRVDNCATMSAFGIISYSSADYVSTLSDFCIDEPNGIVTGAEAQVGL